MIFNWSALVWPYWLLRDQSAFVAVVMAAATGTCHPYSVRDPRLCCPGLFLVIQQLKAWPKGNLQGSEPPLQPGTILSGWGVRVWKLILATSVYALRSYSCLWCVSPHCSSLERSPHWPCLLGGTYVNHLQLSVKQLVNVVGLHPQRLGLFIPEWSLEVTVTRLI